MVTKKKDTLLKSNFFKHFFIYCLQDANPNEMNRASDSVEPDDRPECGKIMTIYFDKVMKDKY